MGTTQLNWIKSSFSSANGQCCEAAHLANGGTALRDSKNPGGGAVTFTRNEWRAFLNGVKLT
ncbi:DUF397 domain-containing protein [Actinokineospora auranticolor]|uniref:Uncharacterized protein DUF397 n=1 Tax=Actinokineospora auranticolor TaxID=155976 RepID=A0A2S6GMU1_9PSEU|nr:DUF397 domain-containing protein [Actinokineospora auranticolor]PPK66545.1 uncharacterized protein DUF397 [Actinokineospora auranticolor]